MTRREATGRRLTARLSSIIESESEQAAGSQVAHDLRALVLRMRGIRAASAELRRQIVINRTRCASPGVQSDSRIGLAMDRRHTNQIAPQQIETPIDGDPQHGIAAQVAVACCDQSGDAARAAQPQHRSE
jgi:hypothetical protein